MITILALAVTLVSTPPAVDNGFATAPPLCSEISWPTLPIDVRSSYIQGLARNKFEDASEYWNGIGIGDVFQIWDPDLVLPVPPLLITATIGLDETWHVNFSIIGCSIVTVALILPASAGYREFVHGLGLALGLARDFGLGSLMQHPDYYTALAIDAGAVIVTAADQQRLLDAVLY